MNLNRLPRPQKFIRRADHGSTAVRAAASGSAVSPGGCSGLAAEFSVEPAPGPGDAVVASDGVKLFLPAESRLLLDGVTIDFADTPTQTGFVFIDPKQRRAACGSTSSTAFRARVSRCEIGSRMFAMDDFGAPPADWPRH